MTSSIAPAMLADMHRTRMLCDELPHCGWSVEMLVPGVAFQRPVYVDPESATLRPDDVPVHEAAPCCDRVFQLLGMRSVGWRALWPMYRLGCRVLSRRRFDLVYISTTQFSLFCLGRLWQRRCGVPYVLDFHDPWLREQTNCGTTRHVLKRRISAWLSRYLERFALDCTAGLVSVSPRYLEQLSGRYPGVACALPERQAVIPFGATRRDFDAARAAEPANRSTRDQATIEVTYVGAGGSIMAKSCRRIVEALASLRAARPELVNRVRIRLYGTNPFWKSGEPKELEVIAQRHGVGDLVVQRPRRIGYLAATRLILGADGVLILGVDDDGYMPSKLFGYALSGKPLLASLHRASPAYEYFRRIPELGHALWFDRHREMPPAEATRIVGAFLDEAAERRTFDRRCVLEPFLAPAMARRHAELFEACLAFPR
ncbi:MAG: glycosyltransferase [Planctomycetes bacterium]|nr:glycosyltransferase [Planctomycetota bacterium]